MDNEETKNQSEGALLRVKRAAELLDVSPRTVWRMIAEGQLKSVRFRHCTRISSVEVLTLLHGGKVGGT